MPRDPEIARVLGALAHLDFEAKRARSAADRFDAAYARDPHPRWAIAAAEAWMAVPNPATARERFLLAGADPQLAADVRTRLAGRIRDAETFAPLVTRARKASDAKDHAKAMTMWLEVFDAMDLGRALLFAARAAEDASQWADAARLFARCGPRSDLSQEEQNEAASALAHARSAIDAEEAARNRPHFTDSESLTGGILLGLGGLMFSGGIAALVAADAEYERIDSALETGRDAPISAMTRREVLELQTFAERWTAVGWVGLAAGAMGLGFGTWLTLREPPRRGRVVPPPARSNVSFGLVPFDDGGFVWARFSR